MLAVGAIEDLRGGIGESRERSIAVWLQRGHQGHGWEKAEREAASFALYIVEIDELTAILAFEKFHRLFSRLRPALFYVR
jgi:hypothetical protein